MMDSDVWERARRFVEEGERQQADMEALPAQYERVNIHGKILVDGHHVFLEMLRDIEAFNHHVKEHPKFLLGRKNIWLDPDPVDVAEATADLIGLLKKAIPLRIGQQLVGLDKTCVSASTTAKGLREGSPRYCAVEGLSEILIFDTRMPSATNVIKELEEKRTICLRQGFAPLDTERRLKLAKTGRWQFGAADDGAPKELPYGFKNKFLDALSQPWRHGWKEHLGKRKIWIDKRGGVRQNEKGVDALLVIAGCEAAADPRLHWTCLVTNDADYVPLVKHLHSRGKAVFLLSLCDPKLQSRDLRRAVRPQYLINKAKLYNDFTEEPIPEPYWSKPALIYLLTYCLF